ncbi:WecB/TagA/CpsF family glycosyltransferase [Hydrogenophaga atypica]|uniref:WecB/TagA/CpsF family glycosyltransferase n=1 Tax=Hydrogenophaga atypica TaxID=249409 RepID=A0ABW2QG61_9BURK
MRPKFQRFSIAGLPFDVLDQAEAVNRVCTAIQRQERLFFSTPNLNFLVMAQEDEAFRQSVLASDLSLADGMPVVWLSRLQGTPLPERVAGSTVFEQLRSGAGQGVLGRPIKVYFFGGPPGVAEKACSVLNAEHAAGRGQMLGVGAFCPGFGSVADMSAPATIAAINASGADLLVVALGAKKGQAWIMHNLDQLTIPVVSHLGAVVNFVAGTVERAPLTWQRWGFEWLWRIRQEPALFKRYWNDGWGLVYLIAHALLVRKKK